jgi:two-component system, LytTR family, sensor kinase
MLPLFDLRKTYFDLHKSNFIEKQECHSFSIYLCPGSKEGAKVKYVNLVIHSNQWGIRFFRHSLFWITDIISYLSVVSVNGVVSSFEFYAVLMRTVPLALTTYFVLYYLIPVFSKKTDYGKLILWLLAVLIFVGIGMRYFNYYVVNPILDISQNINFSVLDFPLIVRNIFSNMSVICLAVTIKLIKNKTDLQQRNDQLETERKAAELNFLKAQMHPHFLFNTLNTLYSETMQQSGKAEQVVLHLSNLLRFILEECNKPLIPLKDEVKVIQDYVELEKLRHGDRLRVSLVVPPIDPAVKISPLLLLPFAENSFKHSLNNIRGQISIQMEFHLVNEQIIFQIENDHIKVNSVRGHGLGVANVKRQLDLLYGTNYLLAVDEADDKYKVSLAIPDQLPAR